MASTAGLLRKASEALERAEDPFSGEFLRDNDVTFDQCMTLSQMMALGARVVAKALEQPRSEAGLAVFSEMASSP